jgi:hypothetical protein
MDIRVVEQPMTLAEVTSIAEKQFGNLVKATADIGRGLLALGGELHADEEQLLLERGSRHQDLWGINLYPTEFGKPAFIEFDSMINLRPSQGNVSRGVDDVAIQTRIREVVQKLIVEQV